MDAVGGAVRTAAGLGRAGGLPGSPVVSLTEAAAGAPAVLLVDQLDAVSEYSGRMADSFEAVAEIVDQAEAAPNIKVILAVRTVDLEEDPRMRNVLAVSPRLERLELTDLDPEEVQAVLGRFGIDGSAADGSMLELLRVPLHLAVFCGLSASARLLTYATLPELYSRYTGDFVQAIEKRIEALDWQNIVATLTAAMSDRESLFVPEAVVGSRFPGEQLRALESAGVLVRQGSQVGFFHETYFDFLLARGFVAAGLDLHDFLAEDRQALFRRAQTRQVLEYLAGADRPAFLTTVCGLLTSDRIRSHLLDVVVAVLRRLPATSADWSVVEPLAFGPSRRSAQLAWLLSEPAWFDAADAAERWDRLLDDSGTQDGAARSLIAAARHRPERVAELIRPRLGSSQRWEDVLMAFGAGASSPGLADLAVALVERGDLDHLRGRPDGFDFWLLLNGAAKTAPAEAARPAAAWLRRAAVRARADGSDDPFASKHLSTRSPSGPGALGRIAAEAPEAFLDEVFPVVVEIATNAARWGPEGALRRWRWGHAPGVPSVDGALLDGAAEALRQLARDRPTAAADYARTLAATNIFDLRVLACQAWAALPGFSDEAVDWLLSDDRNLLLQKACYDLLAAASQHCDERRLQALLGRLLEYYPDDETGPEDVHRRGQAQYWLLTALDPARRGTAAEQRLTELAPKFAEPLAPFEDFHTGTVEPPISPDGAALLSDDAWRVKIREYPDDTTDWSRRPPVSGAPGLASRLRERATAEPERFTSLALTLGADIAPVYLTNVVDAVAGSLPADRFAELCIHVRAVAGLAAGPDVCRAIGGSAAHHPGLLTVVEGFLDDAEPKQDVTAATGPTSYEESAAAAQRGATRAAAGEAVAQVLHTAPRHSARLLPMVRRLAIDPSRTVRDTAAAAAGALLLAEPEAALQIATTVLDAITAEEPPGPHTMHLLGAVFQQNPDRFASYLLHAMNGPEPVVAEYAGAIWAYQSLRGDLPAVLPRTVDALPLAAQRGATDQFATQPAEAFDQLVALFDDQDPQVRQNASTTFDRLDHMPETVATALVDAFTRSAAFAENLDEIFHAFQRSNRLLPETALDACQRAINLTGTDLGDIRTAAAGAAIDIVGLVLRIYRQGHEPLRNRCLNVIDQLSDAGAFDLQDALAAAR
ncbi:hypothetical protein [Pseudofrankia sp. BMG5.37]|uniref:hypothetical protein n=1 Tax=Pseudofrankia sp. BMG5.37 TaxID=3050035 RepID=UPI002894B762|nr:hypothetical protein [Pseudofrankia sp. BMG5.37]MDT3443598.1 hypothetical protein [Pseudofrankia sp. BMG5.37]